ncbi:MAG: malate dehydrogenase [Magnetococcales bacterium]|nr:malate dehydrogenase [Magnetococcales bacterium]NGZ05386.1 malate dehydrogenase [Magnetococcales bacterium]
MAEPIRVAVTGAAGQIAYSAIFRLASGAVFGPDRPVHLSLLEIPPAMKVLESVVMELDDCAFPTLVGVEMTDQANQAFDGVNAALLIGSRPRGPGMERADLIRVNGPIFVGQGQALNRAAADVRVVVVGNPCNTNCLIAMSNSDVPKDRFSAMMRLDYNRAKTMLAKKAGVPVTAVTNLAIWGNHSNNQYPDFENARIHGQPLTNVITDQNWLQETFVPDVQTRGAVVIKARGSSSAASGAIAALDHLLSLRQPTPEGDWFVAAVLSTGEYGVDPGLIFGYPLRVKGDGWEIVEGLTLSDWGQVKFNKVLDELRQEREVVKDLL